MSEPAKGTPAEQPEQPESKPASESEPQPDQGAPAVAPTEPPPEEPSTPPERVPPEPEPKPDLSQSDIALAAHVEELQEAVGGPVELQIPTEAPQRSLKTAYLWLLILGWIGAHRFYLRRNYSGGLFAMTGGFLLFGLAIDLLLLPSIVRKENEALALEFKADPKSFAKIVRKPPAWASEGGGAFSGCLQLPFLLAFWICGPPILAFIAILTGHLEAALLVLAILVLTAFMQAARRLVDKEPGLLRLMVIGPALKSLLDLEDYYYENKPRPVIVYLIYPLVAPLLLLFSKSAREEARMFWRPAGLILAALVADAVATYPGTYPPYLGVEDAVMMTILGIMGLLFMMVAFLLPTVATSVALNISGRTTQARFLAAAAIPLTVLTIYGMREISKGETSLPAGLLLKKRLERPKFREDLTRRASMVLTYEQARLSRKEAGVSNVDSLTKTIRAVLTGIVPTPEQPSFRVFRLDTPSGNPALFLSCDYPDDGSRVHLLLAARDGEVYESWGALPSDVRDAYLADLKAHHIEDESERLIAEWGKVWEKRRRKPYTPPGASPPPSAPTPTPSAGAPR